MNEEEKSVSLADIFRVIGKKVWAALGGAIVLALCAVLVFMFAINPMKSSSSLSFRLRYPMSAMEKLPDGTPFYYGNLVSPAILTAAKESDESFSSLDIGKMLENEQISVTATITEQDTYYTLTVKNSLFVKNGAEKYIVAVTTALCNSIKASAQSVDYGIDEATFNGASFSDKLALLNMQKTTLVESYKDWIEEYTASYSVGGRTLGNYLADLSVVYGDTTKIALEDTMKLYGLDSFDLNGYKRDPDGTIALHKTQLSLEHSLNENIIAALESAMNGGENASAQAVSLNAAPAGAQQNKEEGEGTTVIIQPSDPDLSAMLASYIKRNQEIEFQEANLTRTAVDTFESRVSAERARLAEAADTLESVTAQIYANDTFPAFVSQKVTESGDTSIILVALCVFVLGFLLLLVVFYFVGKKQQKAAPAPHAEKEEKTPSGEEVQE